MKTFRAFNLTDLETPELKAKGLVNKPIIIGAIIVQPGQFADVPDNPQTRAQATQAVLDGLISVGNLTPKYALTKSRLQQGRRIPVPTAAIAPKPRVKTFFHKKTRST